MNEPRQILFGVTFFVAVISIALHFTKASLHKEEIEYYRNKITEVNDRWEGMAVASNCARFNPDTGEFEWKPDS